MELIIYPDFLSEKYLQIVPIDMDFKLYHFAFAAANLVVCELIERFVVPCFSEISRRRRMKKLRTKVSVEMFNSSLRELMKVATGN